jgi:hypothetical protein
MEFEILGANNQTYPADLATARVWVKEGRIVRSTQVYSAARGEWTTAGEIAGIFPQRADGDAPPIVAERGAPPIVSETAAEAERKSNGLKLALGIGLAGIFLAMIPPIALFGFAAILGGFALFLVWLVRYYM